MSQKLQRTYSLRKSIRPIVDRDEEDDDRRRDATGRKRVDVVECLLDSSSDELDDFYPVIDSTSPILWLNFNEICHIRSVLAQTMLSILMVHDDKEASKIQHGRLCFRCRKSIHDWSFFLPSFLRFTRTYHCSVCQQSICRACSSTKFVAPARKLAIPIRIQTLLKPSSLPLSTAQSTGRETLNDPAGSRTICLDCLQVFDEHRQTSSTRAEPVATSFRRTLSLPPASSRTTAAEPRHTRHRRRRPVQITNCKIETKTITTTSVIAEL